MRELVIGSHNRHKCREIAQMLPQWRVLSLQDLKVEEEPEEKGSTFLENALEKALFFSQKLPGRLILADDSGLEVEALDGAPGVRSKRYASAEGDSKKNNAKLLKELEGVPFSQRRAQFRCAMVLARDGEVLFHGEGIVRGYIGHTLEGQGGFGYDPLFFYPPLGRTFAQLSGEEKNAVSHRSLALRTVLEFLRS